MSLSETHHPVPVPVVMGKVPCIAADERLPGEILVPETASNIDFGGLAEHSPFIIATTSNSSVILNRKGTQWP